MVPLIGVTTYVAPTTWSSWTRRAGVLPASYYELLAAAGARPLLLPPLAQAPQGPGQGAADVVDVLDGLVLTGGGDVDPAAYGQEADPRTGGVDVVRDASEQALLAAALELDLPVLAICRGLQVLNVGLGGSLHQHVPDVTGTDLHRSAPLVFGQVGVETVPGTTAAEVFGPAPTVLCSHHQSIDRLGEGLVASARAADGVIEAVELPAQRFVFGVQWHPEEGDDQRPFSALVQAAGEYRRERAAGSRALRPGA